MEMGNENNTENNIIEKLNGFNGSENFHRDPFNKCVFTDGFYEFMKLCRCNWLFSDSAIQIMMDKKFKGEDFILFKLKKIGSSAEVIFDNGNGIVLYKKKYNYTDFPLQEFEFFACRNELGTFTFMLKSEY